jgi:hypothetical protein
MLGAASFVLPAKALAGPVAGTSILNTATGVGSFVLSGATFSQNSNTVRAIVQPLEAVQLAAPRAATVAPSLPFAFAHRLTNLGNDTFDFRVDLANAAGDGFDVTGLTLARDMDGTAPLAQAISCSHPARRSRSPRRLGDLLVAGTVP